MSESTTMTLEQIQQLMDTSPLIRFLGLSCTRVDVEAGILELNMPKGSQLERIESSGQFHGGAVAALIDTAGAFAVVMRTQATVPTINFRVDYLRPSTGGFLLAKAPVRRVGKTIGVVDVDVFDEQERLTAVGRGCFGVALA